MAEKDIQADPRFAGASVEKVDAPNHSGVLQVEDKGDGVVIVRGHRGEIAVEYLGDATEIPADLRQKITDLVVEYSAQAGHDPRHSEWDPSNQTEGPVAPEVPQEDQVVVNQNLPVDQNNGGGGDGSGANASSQPASSAAPSAPAGATSSNGSNNK